MDLTICTVSFHSQRLLEINRKLVTHLNGAMEIIWLVAQNTPAEAQEAITLHPGCFEVVAGSVYDPSRHLPASYHHGLSLNKIVRMVQTRFLLVLDPDFFIVRRNWLGDIIDHMKAKGIALLGTPWHPRWYYKYRYFPCVHCLFVDLAQVDKEALDFRPGQPDKSAHPPISVGARLRIALELLIGLHYRRSIGNSLDTGWRLYQRFSADKQVTVECVMPVYRPKEEYPVRPYINRLIDELLPDRLSYIPKQRGYFTQSGFRERNLPDTTCYGWEEFIWKDAPFGFHLRGAMIQPDSLDQQMSNLAHALESLACFEAISSRGK